MNAATCFIGRGSSNSSTEKYRLRAGKFANKGQYSKYDKVFISVEGNRSNRLSFDKDEVNKAVDANADFIVDNSYHRNREYNIGEREIYEFLTTNGYHVIYNGTYFSILTKKEFE